MRTELKFHPAMTLQAAARIAHQHNRRLILEFKNGKAFVTTQPLSDDNAFAINKAIDEIAEIDAMKEPT